MGKHAPAFAAIVVLVVIAAGVAAYVLPKQRFSPPAWVPIVGKDFYELTAEFQTGQAVTPGQGQTVNIAGVRVGEISRVELEEGQALVTMNVERKFAEGRDGRPAVYRDARMLLRPKTGLKDMIVELTPGTPSAGRLPDGGTIPVSNTLPDVNFDEVLATLDADTRSYLVLLLNGAGDGLDGRSRDLASTLRRFEPTARDGARITSQLKARGANVRRVINNLRKLSEALGDKDDHLAQLVESADAVFASLAGQEANIRSTLRELPPSLTRTQDALGKVDTLAGTLGPALRQLRPTARALGPALRETRPFLRGATPMVRDQLRPFTVTATPVVRALRPAARDLGALTPNLVSVFRILNYALNEIAYNPAGSEEGYLFWISWANHAANTLFTTGDAHGPIRRGEFLTSCSSLELLDQVATTTPQLAVLIGLLNAPRTSSVCPTDTGSSGRPGGTRSTGGEDDTSREGLGPAVQRPGAAGADTRNEDAGAGARAGPPSPTNPGRQDASAGETSTPEPSRRQGPSAGDPSNPVPREGR